MSVIASTSAAVLVVGAIVSVYLVPAAICAMKGKLWTLAGGLFVPVLLWVGALRLAKPDSWWARSEYDQEQMERATVRYGVS